MNRQSEKDMTQVTDLPSPQSPVQDWMNSRGAQQRAINGSSFFVRFATDNTEHKTMQSLGLCDMSGLQKFGLKGRDAESLLRNVNIDVPANIFESRRLVDDGLIIRFGADEFFLENGIRNKSVSVISRQLDLQNRQAFHVDHQEATFLLTGSRVLTVLSQTCGIDFQQATPRQAIFTRVAGVSCCVFPDEADGFLCYRIWVDPSYAVYLWDTLVAVCENLGGSVIGAGCIFPELLS